MIEENKTSRWDFIGKEREVEQKRETEKQAEISKAARPEDFLVDLIWQCHNSFSSENHREYVIKYHLLGSAFLEEVAHFVGCLAQKYCISDIHTMLLLCSMVIVNVSGSDNWLEEDYRKNILSHKFSEVLYQEVEEGALPLKEKFNELSNVNKMLVKLIWVKLLKLETS
jgi:hypothetical protein